MPLSTIIAGCDLSDPSDRAIDRAIALAEHHRARLVLVHAHSEGSELSEGADREGGMMAQLAEVASAMRSVEAAQLAERLAALRARGLNADTIAREGAPGETLAEVAEELGAELIVVGTHGRTGISRFLLGSVAIQTLRHATCDVLVCRPPIAAALFRRPMIAIDFTPIAAKLVDRAVDIAPGASLDAIHAWQLPIGSWGATLLGQARFPWSAVQDAVHSSTKAAADQLVAEQAARGRMLHIDLVQGPASSVLTETAQRDGRDVIVMGAHGRRGFRRLLLGSVAESTIQHSPCSVLVVHTETSVAPAAR